MYGTLALSHRALDDLAESTGEAAIAELRALARPVEGLRVLNLSVTGFGTGTAELLNSSVPLLTDLGLDCHWQVVRASEDADSVSRAMYRALGGADIDWTHEMSETWQRYAAMNAALLTERFDVVIVHDPQPAAIRSHVTDGSDTKWIFHSHLDLSTAQPDVWMELRDHVEAYDGVIFELPTFAPQDLKLPVRIVPPAIDPNSARNMPLAEDIVRTVLARHGIDPARPYVCQVSPCDAASDLPGALEAVQQAAAARPGLQMAFVLTTEPQDQAARASYEELARRCREEPDVRVLPAGNEVGNAEVNVFQRGASAVIQKGLRKGYGLWVSDALWKKRPCVVAPAPGLLEQVIDGETGLVARTTGEFASAIGSLLDDPATAARYGERGRQLVGERFLITRYLRDYLQVLHETQKAN